MQKLLEIAKSRGCRAEVFSIRERDLSMSKVNGAVSDVSASIQSGVSLRVIKNGKIGMAYTKNLINREELVDNAMVSLNAGVEADYDFPESGTASNVLDYDPAVEEKGYSCLKDLISGMEPLYRNLKAGVLSISAGVVTSEITIKNTSGANLLQKDSGVYSAASVLYPGTSSGLRTIFQGKSGVVLHLPDVTRTVEFFNNSLPEVEIGEGRMKVLIAPEVMYALTWRLGSATSGQAFYEKVSPLMEKKGTQVISPLLSLVSDPTTGKPGTRLFDDEGIKTGRVPVFEKGVFANVYNNLNYAAKLGEEPLGMAFRGGMWGGEKVALSPAPSLSYANFETGDKSFDEIISMMDRGVIIYGALGAHSGNILNGDMSIGLSPGLYVENGKVTGRVKDGMVAGNVYELLNNVIAVEDSSHYTGSVYENPSILLDNVSVVGS